MPYARNPFFRLDYIVNQREEDDKDFRVEGEDRE